eukprot:5624587-Pleurochrysis_carterae.AAC.1
MWNGVYSASEISAKARPPLTAAHSHSLCTPCVHTVRSHHASTSSLHAAPLQRPIAPCAYAGASHHPFTPHRHAHYTFTPFAPYFLTEYLPHAMRTMLATESERVITSS